MRLRGAIKQIDFQSGAGTVIPNSTSLEFDEETELRFVLDNVTLTEALKLYLVPGLQVFFSVVQAPYAGFDAEHVIPALTGRYRARCIHAGTAKVFIPDLQIAAELEQGSTFEIGGVDCLQRNDEILVTLTWDEIIRSQIEQRVPKVIACGTLTTRGYPFLTDNMKQMLRDNSRQDNYELAQKPFEKLDRSSTPDEWFETSGRRRSKSFTGLPAQRCIGSLDELSASRSGSGFSYMGFPAQLHAMSQARFDPFHNPFGQTSLHALNPRTSRSNCPCFRF